MNMKVLQISTVENKKTRALNTINFNASITKSGKIFSDKITLSTKANERAVKIRALYSKFQTSLPQVKPNTIEAIIKKYPEYPPNDILAVMDRLTAFSNMKSFVGLKKFFKEERIARFTTFQNIYDFLPKYKRVESKHKEIEFHALTDAFKRNKPILLNHVMHYLFTTPTAKAPLGFGGDCGIVLDENTLDLLENLKNKDKEVFNRYKEQKFFIVKDLENTYNIFSQDVDFEDIVRKNMERFSKFKKHNPEKSPRQIADMMLNGNLILKAKRLGIKPIIIDTVLDTRPSTTSIAQKLSPQIPNYENFENAINIALDKISLLNWKKNMAIDLINERSYILSPKTMAIKLKQLKGMIEEDVKSKGRDVNKIYYNVPVLDKSYSLVNYMYQKINKIDVSRYIYCNTSKYWCLRDLYKELGKNLPEGATLVTIDDAMISGESMFEYPLNYLPNRETTDYDMVFASIYSTDKAQAKLDKIKGEIKNNDRIISIDIQKFNEDFNNKSYLPNFSKRSFIMMPHIAPDNNPGELRAFFRLFYPDNEFVSETWDEN